jgi:hypothetical protein
MRIVWLATIGLCLLLGAASFSSFLELIRSGSHTSCKEPFCDFEVYALALERVRDGVSPYVLTDALIFVYPPIFLDLFAPFPDPTFRAVMLGGYAIATVAFFLAAPRMALPATLVTAPGGALAFAVLSGNVALFGHLAAAAAAFAGARRRDWRILMVIACGLALMKPYFLAYLTIPALAAAPEARARALLESCVAFAIYAAIMATSAALQPEIAKEFLAALNAQVVDGGNVGTGFAFLFQRILEDPVAAITLHTAASAAMFFAAIRASDYVRAHASPMLSKRETRVALLCIAAILCNPRLNHYDYAASDILIALLFLSTPRIALRLGFVAAFLVSKLVVSNAFAASEDAFARVGFMLLSIWLLPCLLLTLAALRGLLDRWQAAKSDLT